MIPDANDGRGGYCPRRTVLDHLLVTAAVWLLFIYSISSALLGGVGRDAEHIVDHIASKE